jgi:hypothetical protein
MYTDICRDKESSGCQLERKHERIAYKLQLVLGM